MGKVLKKLGEFLKYLFNQRIPKYEPIKMDVPWMKQLRAWEGGSEFDSKFVELLNDGWKYTNVPDYKGLKGRERAWCAMSLGFALIKTGYKSTNKADAKSYSTYGMSANDFNYGSILCIRHPKGNYHVTCFVRWKNELQKIAICLGGNQGNKLQESEYNLSGNSKGHYEVIGGPRWPIK